MKQAIPYIIAALVSAYFIKSHHCMYKFCPNQWRITFYTDCEDGVDCYYIDRIHWEHPGWTADECEDYLFNTEN